MGRLVRKAIIIFHHSLVNSIKRYGEPEDSIIVWLILSRDMVSLKI